MQITWEFGTGPATTQELADLIEAEGRLVTGHFLGDDGRCLWGVIYDYTVYASRVRRLDPQSYDALQRARLRAIDSDLFVGTPEQRCAEMVKRLRAIS